MNVVSTPNPEAATIGRSRSDPIESEAATAALAGRGAFDLRYIVAAIRANLLLIIAIIAAVFAIATIATMLQTPRYTARTTVQINDASGSVLGRDSEMETDSNNSDWDIDRFLKTQTDIIASRGLAQRVAQRLKLVGNEKFFASQEAELPPPDTSPEMMRRLTMNLLMANMVVTLPSDSRIVTISYASTDPAMSAMVANAYASEYIQSNLQRKYDSSAYARDFISTQLIEVKDRLEASERQLNNYARNAGLIRTNTGLSGSDKDASSGEGGSVTTASLVQLNTALNNARSARVQAESKWRVIAGVPLLSSQPVLANATVNQLLGDRARAVAQLQQERAKRLDDYPTVRALEAQVSTLNSQLQSAATGVRNSVKAEYDSALLAENQLERQVSVLKGDTQSEQDRGVQYALLAREVDTNRQLYDGLLQRFKALNASSGVSLSNVSIIDVAEAPRRPSSPNLLMNLLIALIAGVGIAVMVVFIKDQFDDSIRIPEDVEAKIDLPLLGVVPKSRTSSLADDLSDPKSPISEAYNSLRSSLMYSTSEGLPRVMLVTSAQASEGKTTTSRAIATGLARIGRRVILIDADMRRPSLHHSFGLPNEVGLATLLTSQGSVEGAYSATSIPNFSVMTSGPIPPSPTELLSSFRIEDIVQQLAAKFDTVIIDSPPVLGLADSPLLSGLVDGVIFVVEADRSRRGSLKTSLRRLRAMRPIILGAVLTKFDPLKGGSRYSEYYGYQYYQYDRQTDS